MVDRVASQLIVAVNPAARSGRAAATGDAVVARLRAAGHDVIELRAADANALATRLRRSLERGAPDAVVAVGGDGLVNLVANVLAKTGIPIGIVPAGSGNDIARSLGLAFDDVPAATAAVLASLETRSVRTIDAVHVSGDRWFVGVLSAGFDAAVNARANRMKRLRGRGRYTAAVLLELARLRPIRYRVTIDRDRRQVDAVLLTVGNTTTMGGGMRITPNAMVDDGLLDVLIAAPLSRKELLRIFPKVFRGTHVDDEHVTIERGRVVTIAAGDYANPPPPAFADGEPMGELPLTLEVVAGALSILA